MNAQYLLGVKREPSHIPGIEMISVGSDQWYAGDYNVVKSKSFISLKKEIIGTVNSFYNRNTSLEEWDWHHVVETEHMATFIFSGSLYHQEYFEMPTVLIHEPEHVYLSQNFNNNTFRELATIKRINRNDFSLNVIKTQEDRDNLAAIISNLQNIYNNLYLNYPTLRRIANNVFRMHLSMLT